MLFGFANPADDPLKIIKSYSLLSFHVITWNIAFARGDLRLLHHNFVGIYQLHDMLPLCMASEPHRNVVFQDGLRFLNYRCIECFRAGGCNIWCPYCPNVSGPSSSRPHSSPSSYPTAPPEHAVAYKADKRKMGRALTAASWVTAQKPPMKLIPAASPPPLSHTSLRPSSTRTLSQNIPRCWPTSDYQPPTKQHRTPHSRMYMACKQMISVPSLRSLLSVTAVTSVSLPPVFTSLTILALPQ